MGKGLSIGEAAWHAGRQTMVTGGFAGVGGALGYAATGTADGALFWANMASMPGQFVASKLVPCFAAGTPVLTPNGHKAIEQIKPGDLVLSRNEADVYGPVEAKLVEECFVREGVILELHMGGQVIRTTPEHPFYVQNRGWTAARELQAGDLLAGPDGHWTCVEALNDTGKVEAVYNLRVADYHTYFIGKEHWGFSVWAHNQYNYGLSGRDALAAAVRKTESLSEAKQLVRTYRDLVTLTTQTESIFQKVGQTYIKAGESAFMKSNPWSRLIFEGTARDRILKELLQQEHAAGRLLDLGFTRQGARGIDVFSGTRFGFDLTTAKAWGRHVSNYRADYDILLPLLYR